MSETIGHILEEHIDEMHLSNARIALTLAEQFKQNPLCNQEQRELLGQYCLQGNAYFIAYEQEPNPVLIDKLVHLEKAMTYSMETYLDSINITKS